MGAKMAHLAIAPVSNRSMTATTMMNPMSSGSGGKFADCRKPDSFKAKSVPMFV
jgi:hypothetical protein